MGPKYPIPPSAVPFTLSIPDNDLLEFKQLLQLSKIGVQTWENQQEDRRFGVTRKWLSETKEYWLTNYDWRAREKYINSFPNFKMSIQDDVGDVSVHFVALFSEKKDAIPILFMHGWPGSFLEFLPICELLKEKYPSADSPYHVIVPSLPGYTFSGGSVDKDWTIPDVSRIMDQLMRNLGFEKYIAQGGDVGSFVAHELAVKYDGCAGVHLNMMRVVPPSEDDVLNDIEKLAVSNAQQWLKQGMAYALEHGSRPSTIGLVLSSSPLALLAWIGEKFLEWTDEDPSLETILDGVTLYWFTSSMPRSIYPYRELFGGPPGGPPYIEKPFGFSLFPYDVAMGTRKNAEKNGNLVFYRQHERGGHFAALEKPKELWQDVEDFVKIAWEKK
ncbi:epoxide hydrolase-like protein [Delitschia confertaspora ATCC 74209]|uniref:Epoxide hydrolase-like protein n=1 Tax=Delitschia confertaspora ATCC 74209 TaxID=1513339 RepID=A0A9P4JLZ5_9PLEO|nr:epoxide hydrolase-like protein [Delitschia confertaspora ATCC 74209]